MSSTNTAKVLSADELSLFCSQLGLMLHAGISSEDAVSALQEDASDPAARKLLDQMNEVLAEGGTLSAALKEAKIFPDYLIRMVEIGQNAGRLDQVLNALAVYYRREASTSASVRRAVAYPAVMSVLVAVVFLVLIVRVLPVFQQVFQQLGLSLSPLVQGLLLAGEAGKYIGAAVLILLAAGSLYLLARSRSANYTSVFSSGPLARGAVGKAVDRSRFVSALDLMLSSGLPLDESMDRAAQLLEGSALSPQLTACANKMLEGVDFTKAASECGLLDGMQTRLLSAGFRAGVLDQAMEELAARCQEQADVLLSRLLTRMEFILVVALCAAVGLVLLSVMLPLLGVLAAIG